MSIVKIIEVISEGNTVDEAIKNAVRDAARTVKLIKQVNVDHIEGIVENDAVVKFRVNARLSFLVEK